MVGLQTLVCEGAEVSSSLIQPRGIAVAIASFSRGQQYVIGTQAPRPKPILSSCNTSHTMTSCILTSRTFLDGPAYDAVAHL